MEMFPYFLMLLGMVKFVTGFCPEPCVCETLSNSVTCNFTNTDYTGIPAPIDTQILTLLSSETNSLVPGPHHFNYSLIPKLQHLQTLVINGFNIQKIDGFSFSKFPDLRILDLSNNNIWSLNVNAFYGLPNLRTLILKGNWLHSAGSTFSFFHLSHLENVNLENNGLSSIPPRTFRQLHNIKNVRLADNYITSISEATLDQWKQAELTTLDLSGNPQLQNLETLSGLTSLDTLSLSSMQIRSIPNFLYNSSSTLKLVSLDLSRNYLVEINQEILDGLNTKAVAVDLTDNRWHCLCNIRPLRQWLIERNTNASRNISKFCDTEDEFCLRCSTPKSVKGRNIASLSEVKIKYCRVIADSLTDEEIVSLQAVSFILLFFIVLMLIYMYYKKRKVHFGTQHVHVDKKLNTTKHGTTKSIAQSSASINKITDHMVDENNGEDHGFSNPVISSGDDYIQTEYDEQINKQLYPVAMSVPLDTDTASSIGDYPTLDTSDLYDCMSPNLSSFLSQPNEQYYDDYATGYTEQQKDKLNVGFQSDDMEIVKPISKTSDV